MKTFLSKEKNQSEPNKAKTEQQNGVTEHLYMLELSILCRALKTETQEGSLRTFIMLVGKAERCRLRRRRGEEMIAAKLQVLFLKATSKHC